MHTDKDIEDADTLCLKGRAKIFHHESQEMIRMNSFNAETMIFYSLWPFPSDSVITVGRTGWKLQVDSLGLSCKFPAPWLCVPKQVT